MHNVKSDHAALIVKCHWRLVTKKTKVKAKNTMLNLLVMSRVRVVEPTER